MVAVCTGASWDQSEALQTGLGHFPQSSSQDKSWGTGKVRRGKEGRGDRNILKNRKKSNAYFGKSLVRLACNQEKNKEKFR